MEAMVHSSDGFELAERDLAIRGAGEVFGERQAGWTDLKLGRLPAGRAHRDRSARGGRARPRRRSRPRAARATARRGRGPPRRSGRVPVQVLEPGRGPWATTDLAIRGVRSPRRVRGFGESSVENAALHVVIRRHQARVRRERHDRGRMAEPVRDCLDRYTTRQQRRGIRVAKIMETDSATTKRHGKSSMTGSSRT